ncbi:voltage-dependent anion-selective channel-like isoform X1 [Aphis gossypii]|uniref:voltage-dependent anion-selective channel-like isoform X1 n=2 Tax=Aphis gossypii TaxID=80765 RepID=UPI0021596A4A|nr:voltage-dependent anion-selective channel-like isoform X1 [Aphis gossypii]
MCSLLLTTTFLSYSHTPFRRSLTRALTGPGEIALTFLSCWYLNNINFIFHSISFRTLLKIPIKMAPSYYDYGRKEREIFDIGYNVLGKCKIDLSTSTQFGITASGFQELESVNVPIYFETRYKFYKSKYLISLAEKWNMNNKNNNITTQVLIGGLLPGFLLTTGGTFDCQKHSIAPRVRCEYTNDYVSLNLDTKFEALKPIIDASAIAVYNGLMGIFFVRYNTSEQVLQFGQIGLSYKAKKFVVTTTVNYKYNFSGSIIRKCIERLYLGLKVCWSPVINRSYIAIAAQYRINRVVMFRAKINLSQLFLSSSIQIKKGVNLTLASILECRQFNQISHKFGIGLQLTC